MEKSTLEIKIEIKNIRRGSYYDRTGQYDCYDEEECNDSKFINSIMDSLEDALTMCYFIKSFHFDKKYVYISVENDDGHEFNTIKNILTLLSIPYEEDFENRKIGIIEFKDSRSVDVLDTKTNKKHTFIKVCKPKAYVSATINLDQITNMTTKEAAKMAEDQLKANNFSAKLEHDKITMEYDWVCLKNN